MIEIHESWKALALVTLSTLNDIEKKSGRKKTLSQAAVEFGQFFTLLAVTGSKELDEKGAESDDKGDTSPGSTKNT